MFTFIEKSTGKEVDGSLLFLDSNITDGHSASIDGIFNVLKESYDISIKL